MNTTMSTWTGSGCLLHTLMCSKSVTPSLGRVDAVTPRSFAPSMKLATKHSCSKRSRECQPKPTLHDVMYANRVLLEAQGGYPLAHLLVGPACCHPSVAKENQADQSKRSDFKLFGGAVTCIFHFLCLSPCPLSPSNSALAPRPLVHLRSALPPHPARLRAIQSPEGLLWLACDHKHGSKTWPVLPDCNKSSWL